ncbi:DUF2180 family protein [Streptomyces sp. NPDC007861]|uniref:DUF2180 family protein n=1 Tax=Streptomyces sp. NPDC007861 TaxID=3154893 RepID=UPI0033C1228C
MRCFDCARRGGEEAAVAVCHECGAGACPTHASAVPRLVHRAAGLGQVSSPVPARRMICRACRIAHQAV